MKKIFVSLLLACTFAACTESDNQVVNPVESETNPRPQSSNMAEAKRQLHQFLDGIYENSWDADGDCIDIPAFEEYVVKNTSLSSDDIRLLEVEDGMRQKLEHKGMTNAQWDVMQAFDTRIKNKRMVVGSTTDINESDIEYARSLCSQKGLNEKETKEIILGITLAQATIEWGDGLGRPMTRGGKGMSYAASFMCNLTVSGICGIYGAWGAGILVGFGVCTGGVATVAMSVVFGIVNCAVSAAIC